MTPKPWGERDNETKKISITLADQLLGVHSRSQLMLTLNITMKFDPNDASLIGVPTYKSLDGVLFVDTEKLRELVAEAIDTGDLSVVPNILNLHHAIKNVIESIKPSSPELARRDTDLTIDPNAVREALRTTDPIDTSALNLPPEDGLRPHRRAGLDETMVIKKDR